MKQLMFINFYNMTKFDIVGLGLGGLLAYMTYNVISGNNLLGTLDKYKKLSLGDSNSEVRELNRLLYKQFENHPDYGINVAGLDRNINEFTSLTKAMLNRLYNITLTNGTNNTNPASVFWDNTLAYDGKNSINLNLYKINWQNIIP